MPLCHCGLCICMWLLLKADMACNLYHRTLPTANAYIPLLSLYTFTTVWRITGKIIRTLSLLSPMHI